MALLKDGHTNVYFPESVSEQIPVDGPWIALTAIERRAIVSNVEPALVDVLPIGSEILSVDGVPVPEYLEEHIFPYIASSTEHILWSNGIRGNLYNGYGLLAGPSGSRVQITVRTPDGELGDLSVVRDRLTRESEYLHPFPEHPLLEFHWLDESIAYVALNSFGNDSIVAEFESLKSELLRARAVVVDLRNNSGGSTGLAKAILNHLMADTVLGSRYRTREHIAAYKAWGRFADQYRWAEEYRDYYTGNAWYESEPDTLKPDATPKVGVPVAVLIGHNTASAAEDFLVFLDGQDRFTLVGQPTFGSTGQPLFFDLPGGGSARVCTKRDTYPDGRDFVGVGVLPEVAAEPTVEDLRAGRDVVIEKAVELLRLRAGGT